MSRYKTLIACAVFIIFNLFLSNPVLALPDEACSCKYPDYSKLFVGCDKCEKFNRKLFSFNLKLNKFVLRPVNTLWASVVPKYGMDRCQCLYCNTNYPIRLMGCLLQKDFKASKQETKRFLINTTIGVAGLYDPAKTKFKIEPRQEDLGQVLAHCKMKPGPYLVLPVVNGNLRDLFGKLLDCPFRPTAYVGPFGAAINAVFAVNNTTYMQPMFKKVDDSFADPYEIAKHVYGIDRYIKNSNLDRIEVLREKTAYQNLVNINNLQDAVFLKPDVELEKFNPQGSLVDSMRTALFDNQQLDKSKWAEMSLWNRTFSKKLKIGSLNLAQGRMNYKYKYILQKKNNSPVAVVYPSFGEGITSEKSVVMAKLLYEAGYSVVIQGSAFNWEFVKSQPKEYCPGLPVEDSHYIRVTTKKILDKIQETQKISFGKKIIVGCSYGAMIGLFVSAEDEKNQEDENHIGISKCIAISPPVEVFYALDKLDKYCLCWDKNPEDLKQNTAITAEKIILVAQKISQKELEKMPEALPFTEDEAKFVISFLMRQKLSDVVFALEGAKRGNKCEVYPMVQNLSFNDYAQKYLFDKSSKSSQELDYESSLHYIAHFLKDSDKYKIYESKDDYFVNASQLSWLKDVSKDKTSIFSNGSHLGFLYRKEFLDSFKRELSLDSELLNKEL